MQPFISFSQITTALKAVSFINPFTSYFKLSNGKKQLLIFILLLGSSISLLAQGETVDEAKAKDLLEGTWTVDLRPTPDAAPYLIDFVIELKDQQTFSGAFYGSPISKGLINRNWEKVYFAFSTRDLSNEYIHSGYLLEGKIYGTTYCPNRDFVAPWQGVKKE